MNERIKELAWSIGIAGKNLQGQIDTDWNQIEKFAELIVKETLRITGAPPSMVETVKKHFGVEE